MPDTREPAHVFRVERCDGELDFIAADEMTASVNGDVLLWLRDGINPSTLVAKIPDHPGLSVTRVANLLTMYGVA